MTHVTMFGSESDKWLRLAALLKYPERGHRAIKEKYKNCFDILLFRYIGNMHKLPFTCPLRPELYASPRCCDYLA